MNLIKKSELFEMSAPLGEPDFDWNTYDFSNRYKVERIENGDGEVIWFGIEVNWKKKPGESWTILSTNEEAKPLDEYLPDIVYGEDRTYWKQCGMPVYEKMYLEYQNEKR